MPVTKKSDSERLADASSQLFGAFEQRMLGLEAGFREIKVEVKEFRNEIKHDLGSIESSAQSIDKAIARMEGQDLGKQVEKNIAQIEKLDTRLGVVEKFQANLSGRLIVIGAITVLLGGIVASLLATVLGKLFH